jgi:general secretion pathway protein E
MSSPRPPSPTSLDKSKESAPPSGLGAKLESVRDLPQGVRPIAAVDLGFEVQEAELEKFVVLALPGYELRGGSEKSKVHLVIEERYQQDIARFFSLRNKLNNKFIIEKTWIASTAKLGVIADIGKASGSEGQRIGQNNTANKFFDDLLLNAIKKKVSDIHLEIRLSGISRIRFRRHGMLVTEADYSEVSSLRLDQVVRSVHDTQADNEGKAQTFRGDTEEQSASITRTLNGQILKIRYQSMVAYPNGYDVVLRVLKEDHSASFTSLKDLGYSPDQVNQIQEIVERPIGALIIAGVTGSGKSTTLKNTIMWLNQERDFSYKFYTIEDPPEYLIPGVTQVPVRQPDEGSSVSPYAAPIKAAMRGDPDVIMIGEIRDNFTADSVKKATQSGHQVLTTIHAPSALGSVERLKGFGLDSGTLGSKDFLVGLLYQRLVPVLCSRCSIPFHEHLARHDATESDIKLARRLEDVFGKEHLDKIKVRGTGCDACMHTGVVDRTVCAEIVQPDFTLLRMFRNDQMIEAYQYWRGKSNRDVRSSNMNGKVVLEHALYKVSTGMCSPVDVETLIARVDSAKREYEELDKEKEEMEQYKNQPSSQGRPAWSA